MATKDAPDHIVYFGDSLSDLGTIHDITSRVLVVPVPPASAGYVDGKFSNGRIQSEVTPELLGIGSTVYAVGGARAVDSRTIQDYIDNNLGTQTPPFNPLLPNPPDADLTFDLNLGAQIQRFRDDNPLGAAEGTAAAFFIGANDYTSFQPTSIPTAPAEAVALVGEVIDSIFTAAQAAFRAGAETALFYNLPPIGFLPISQFLSLQELALGEAMIAGHNAALAEGVGQLRGLGLDARIIDIARISAEIDTDPSSFGFRPALVREPVLLGTGANPILILGPNGPNGVFLPNSDVAGIDQNQLPFYDLVHPTEAGHGVLGVFAAESLSSRTWFRGGGDDVILASSKDDLVLAGAGNDWVATLGGDDVVLAGLGKDRVWTGSGDDIASGGSGRDVLYGDKGNDVLADAAGNDWSFGGTGRDLLVDGLGRDFLFGGAAADAFLYVEAALLGEENARNGGHFSGGSGKDTLYLALSTATRAAVETEIAGGSGARELAAIDVRTRGIEHFVFVDPADPAAGIDTNARLAEADLWGFV